jgi:hypothetical protein
MSKEREVSRRALIQWGLATGAALGVSPSRIVEIFERTAGRGIAEAAAATPTKRSVHLRAGNGGLAYYTLLWPHNDVAATAGQNPATTWPFTPAETSVVQGTGGKLTLGVNTPFATNEPAKQMTAFMAGSNEQHTNNPNSIVRSLSGNSMFAIASLLQTANPTVVPVITVDDVQLGTAPGAPRAAVVQTGRDIVGLFNSAASRTSGLLDKMRYTGHADLYRAHFETLAQLNRAAGLTTTRDAYSTARAAARFVGTNLAAQLAITPADEAAYGIDGTMRADLQDIARTLIVTAKAFQLRLTSSVILPALRDDPHTAFQNVTQLRTDTAKLKGVLDAFMTDLRNRTDSITQTPLSENLVITIEGDTPKDPLNRNNWGDNTNQNSNWIYVYGGGRLKSGWFGEYDHNGNVRGFDPATGAATAYDGDQQAQAVAGAVAYAIIGDKRRVGDFTRIDISGLIV